MLRLADLLTHLSDYSVSGNVDIEITGLTSDSRTCKPDYLFAAFPGTQADGRDFINDAITRGATAILTTLDTPIEADICVLRHDDPRMVLGKIAAQFYTPQPSHIAAVTGTNGKSSVVHFCRQLWQGMGVNAVSIGTLGVISNTPSLEGGEDGNLTTPDTVHLHHMLYSLHQQSVDYVVLEASSIGLDQSRLAGISTNVAAITNLSRDHLDYHGDAESYKQAKLKLFDEVLAEDGVAVLNTDMPEYEEITKHCTGQKILSYGRQGKDLVLLEAASTANGQTLTFTYAGDTHIVALPLIGAFQAYNILCALGMVVASGCDAGQAIAALAEITAVPGRMEQVAVHPCGASILVDYAHTPDALKQVLAALRSHVQEGRLTVLFGCGGDRDKGKRSQMGGIAAQLADKVIVTDDNSRNEDPAVIRREILAACPDATEIPGRQKAITQAVQQLEAGDVLLLAGKGHEDYEIIGEEKHPFNEREIVQAAL